VAPTIASSATPPPSVQPPAPDDADTAVSDPESIDKGGGGSGLDIFVAILGIVLFVALVGFGIAYWNRRKHEQIRGDRANRDAAAQNERVVVKNAASFNPTFAAQRQRQENIAAHQPPANPVANPACAAPDKTAAGYTLTLGEVAQDGAIVHRSGRGFGPKKGPEGPQQQQLPIAGMKANAMYSATDGPAVPVMPVMPVYHSVNGEDGGPANRPVHSATTNSAAGPEVKQSQAEPSAPQNPEYAGCTPKQPAMYVFPGIWHAPLTVLGVGD